LPLSIREKVLGLEHPDTGQNIFDLAALLRDKGNHTDAEPLYRRILSIHDNFVKQGTAISLKFISLVGACHSNLAFHSYVPAKNWKEAEYHYYRQALDLFNKVPNPLEAANVELNLQNLFHLSGKEPDLARVKELTRILEVGGDKRAEKGYMLLREVS